MRAVIAAIRNILTCALFAWLFWIVLFSRPARPHQLWADGSTIPPWVKSSCCGPADAHILGPNDYSIDAEGFHVKGIKMVVPLDKILPSQDGQVWAFYPFLGENANIYCVFYSGSI